MRKICIVTGSRAEYGLLSELMQKIRETDGLQLQIIATNMHLSPEFGLTYKEIENDGFRIDKKIEMLLSSDTSNATTKSVGLGMIGFADAYEDLSPDIIVVLGDRYELLSAVSAALFFKIPVAHLHGGEITEGAYDDSIRHSITKLSHLHFTSTEEYRRRVIQLGESPERVFNVGALGVENIKHCSFLDQKKLEESLNFEFGEKSLLVTFHPVTLEKYTACQQCDNLLEVLDTHTEFRIVFTHPNSDTDGRVIMQRIHNFVSKNKERAISFNSLGKIRYLSALKCVSAVVGNSSSGILEVPSFGIPTLDIGNRQKGRIAAGSVVHCGSAVNEIEDGLNMIFSEEILSIAKSRNNPYEKEKTVESIIRVLKSYSLEGIILKSFYNL